MNLDFYPSSTLEWNQVTKDIANKLKTIIPDLKINFTFFEYEETSITLSLESFDNLCKISKDLFYNSEDKLVIKNLFLTNYQKHFLVYCDVEFHDYNNGIPQNVKIFFDIEESID